jgi:hypothetical protein
MMHYRSVDCFSKVLAVEIEIRLDGPLAASLIVLLAERDIFHVNWAT